MPNINAGVALEDVSLVTVGGTVAGAGNLISGNNNYGSPGGVCIENGATQNVVEGNLIGTDITGLNALSDTVSTEYGVLIASGASGNTIGGTTPAARNVISGNYGWGVGIDGPTTTGNVVEGNYIGTNLNGTANLGNAAVNPQFIGVVISNAPGNTVGGTAAGAGNVISGNSQDGVQITDYDYVNQDLGSSATSNVVAGNLIGTDVTGTVAIANAIGVEIASGASGNTIGGLTATPGTEAGNVISGNNGPGISDSGGSNLIVGNLIGTNAGGTAALANGSDGIDVLASGDTIGGTASGTGNVISGNTGEGIALSSFSNVIAGNLIGTNITGTLALPNSTGVDDGGYDNTIGGTAAGAGNLISGNAANGFTTAGDGSDDVIVGNKIGTDITGTVALANQGDGLEILTPGNTIGGTTAGAGNLISGNTAYGIYITYGGGVAVTGELIIGNRIGTNVTGTAALGNGGSGVGIGDASDNTIGGTGAGAGNLISGNAGAGVASGGTNTSGNFVIGNFIGTNASGTAAIGNQFGVELAATGNTVGGTAAGAGNLVSGNEYGVLITGPGITDNLVAGNKIGTDPTGTVAVGNVIGVLVKSGATSNTVGGTGLGAGNLISGNTTYGVEIGTFGVANTSGNLFAGNLIGTNAAGTSALANATGVYVYDAATNNTIGGTASGAGNVISGNTTDGVEISGTGTIRQRRRGQPDRHRHPQALSRSPTARAVSRSTPAPRATRSAARQPVHAT